MDLILRALFHDDEYPILHAVEPPQILDSLSNLFGRLDAYGVEYTVHRRRKYDVHVRTFDGDYGNGLTVGDALADLLRHLDADDIAA